MTRRMFLPCLLHVAAVALIALAATLIASLPVQSPMLSISTGATAALLANAFLPCPCHRKAGRR